VSAGDGADAQEYAETYKLKFRADSLRRQGLHAEKLVVYYARGDSMEPRIRKGDAIMFDTSDTRPIDDTIYVVQFQGALYAKRANMIDGKVYFQSDNPSGDHNWRKPRRMDDPKQPIEVLGRVRWIGSWEK
jgi:phage repressor protein C with HTH and peptisase S24 domain